ncbi:MAG TPA: MFS transporter [Devosia sp.]|nr:MFS transporter [Devosia sp.]
MMLSRVARIRAVFFLHAIASGGLYPRLPAIAQRLGLDVASLGLVLAGFTLGTMATFFFVSRIVESQGPKRILVACLTVLPLATALLAAMPSGPALFGWFAIYGVIYSLPNAAMNIEADRVEAATGQRVMNSCHGLWSIGYLAATLIGTLAEGTHISPLMHLGLLAVPLVPIALWTTLGMEPAPPRPHAAQTVRRLALPTLPILLLVAYSIGPNLLEGGLRNWSVLYMRDSFSAPSWVDTLTLPVFLVSQAIGRLSADRWVTRFGVVATGRVLTLLALIGCAAVVLAPNLYVALAGFLVIGVGVCTTYPLTTSAAARIGDRPSSQNVASLTFANQLVQFAAPPTLGGLASLLGIRIVFGAALPLLVASLGLARALAPKRGP